jgi:tetratricopeptide (TPR) repeat protein
MVRSARFPVLAIAALAALSLLSGCNRLQARDQLNKGVQAYKSAKYDAAISHFQNAVQLDPSLPMARLYLATAYMQQVIPGSDDKQNVQLATDAIKIYKDVLAKDPHDVPSFKGIAALYFDIKNLDEAKKWQKQVLQEDPKDAEAAYTVGVIDWTEAHENMLKALNPIGINDDGQGNAKMPKPVCATIRNENSALVSEGIEYLQKAVDNRPNYDDAMVYLNLVYRRQADLACGDDRARKESVANADSWKDKAMGARKANEAAKEKKTGGGIVMDANGNMK